MKKLYKWLLNIYGNLLVKEYNKFLKTLDGRHISSISKEEIQRDQKLINEIHWFNEEWRQYGNVN